jgi:hypothetical protein
MVRITVLALLLELSACSQQTKPLPEQGSSPNHRIPALSELRERSLMEAQKLLGKPSQEEEFVLGEGMNSEFRVGLKNYFDFSDSLARQNRIREVTWPYGFGIELGQPKLLTIWYVKQGRQWEYVDLFEWHEGDTF